jgi:hypothetical protein
MNGLLPALGGGGFAAAQHEEMATPMEENPLQAKSSSQNAPSCQISRSRCAT